MVRAWAWLPRVWSNPYWPSHPNQICAHQPINRWCAKQRFFLPGKVTAIGGLAWIVDAGLVQPIAGSSDCLRNPHNISKTPWRNPTHQNNWVQKGEASLRCVPQSVVMDQKRWRGIAHHVETFVRLLWHNCHPPSHKTKVKTLHFQVRRFLSVKADCAREEQVRPSRVKIHKASWALANAAWRVFRSDTGKAQFYSRSTSVLRNDQWVLDMELKNVTSAKFWATTRSRHECATTCASWFLRFHLLIITKWADELRCLGQTATGEANFGSVHSCVSHLSCSTTIITCILSASKKNNSVQDPSVNWKPMYESQNPRKVFLGPSVKQMERTSSGWNIFLWIPQLGGHF